MTTLLVIAKEPRPGRVKTRLTPPFTPREAATLAEATLVDTLRTVAATPARRRVLVLDGAPGPWLPPGFDVVPQCAGGLDERLAAAFAGCDGPALLIGMDHPPGDARTAHRRLPRRERHRRHSRHGRPLFPWARLGTPALLRLATRAGWRPERQWTTGGRSFVALRNRRDRSRNTTAEPPNSTAVIKSQRDRNSSPDRVVAEL